LWEKDDAETALKPFRDLCRRRAIDCLVVWELQKRGSWHANVLVDRFLDVTWLRPWMVKRGWGPQMMAKHVQRDTQHGQQLSRYLCKRLSWYLSKQFVEPVAKHKKIFEASASVKCGTIRFKWVPWEKAGAYLWAMGASLFRSLYGRAPRFKDMGHVIRLGVEDTGWVDVDPLWEFSVPT
jgi:hypothetical protein